MIAVTLLVSSVAAVVVFDIGSNLLNDKPNTDISKLEFQEQDQDVIIKPLSVDQDSRIAVIRDRNGKKLIEISSKETGEFISLSEESNITLIQNETFSFINLNTNTLVDKYTVPPNIGMKEEVVEYLNTTSVIVVDGGLSNNKPSSNLYKTISKGIEEFDNNKHSKIVVLENNYNENVLIPDRRSKKKLKLEGINKEKVIVNGQGNSNVIKTENDNIDIKSMTLKNANTGITISKTAGTMTVDNVIIEDVNTGVNFGYKAGSKSQTPTVKNSIIKPSNNIAKTGYKAKGKIKNSKLDTNSVDNSRGSLDLKKNWWGGPNGPDKSSNIIKNTRTSWDRWCTTEDCSSLSPVRLSGDGKSYTTIQGAIDDGVSTINLEDRTYNINEYNIGQIKTSNANGVSIEGSGPSRTKIKGTGSDTIISIRNVYEKSVSMSDLTISNADTGLVVNNEFNMDNVKVENIDDVAVKLSSYRNLNIDNSVLESSNNILFAGFRSNINVRNSSLYGDIGDGGGSLDLKKNWWGGPNGPDGSLDSIKTPRVSWDRWCTTEDCSSLSPVRLSGDGNGYTTIQGAVNDKVSTINLEDRTYNIDEYDIGQIKTSYSNGIAIKGSGFSETIIKGTGSDTIMRIRDVYEKSVSMSDLTISNADTGLVVNNEFSIDNVKIKNIKDLAIKHTTYANLNIDNSVLESSNNILSVTDRYSNIYARNSSLYGTFGSIDYTTTMDLKNNWWGDSSGPSQSVIDSAGSSTFNYDPWCTNSNCTSLSS